MSDLSFHKDNVQIGNIVQLEINLQRFWVEVVNINYDAGILQGRVLDYLLYTNCDLNSILPFTFKHIFNLKSSILDY